MGGRVAIQNYVKKWAIILFSHYIYLEDYSQAIIQVSQKRVSKHAIANA